MEWNLCSEWQWLLCTLKPWCKNTDERMVGSQAEVTIPFFLCSLSLFIPFDLSILFFISLWWVLWDIFEPHNICFCCQIVVWQQTNHCLSWTSVFIPVKQRRWSLSSCSLRSLWKRKEKECTECSRHPGKRRCIPKVIYLSHGALVNWDNMWNIWSSMEHKQHMYLSCYD